MTPLEEFDKAIADITDRRGAVYDHPCNNFRRIMAMWAVINECPDELIRHALCMIESGQRISTLRTFLMLIR